MKRKIKKIFTLIFCIALLLGIAATYYTSQNWTIRFKSELDSFFGKGNWQCISEETKDSIVYTEYIRVRSNPALSEEVPGKFKNWYISFENKDREEEVWYITNHVMKINHDRYGWFSSKRYSAKQALTLELMDIAFGMIGEQVHEGIVQAVLSEEEAECIEVIMTYTGGNPRPDFYDQLNQEDWFNIQDISAEKFLSYESFDFYLYIRAHDYRLEKLSEDQQANVLTSLEALEQKLLQTYGLNASFEIYLDSEHKSEYKDGKKVASE